MVNLGVMELFTALTGIATFVLVGLAGWQLWLLREEAKRDRRPYVFVQVSKGQTRAGKDALYLSFTNYGRTPAMRVRASFHRPDWKKLGNRTLAFERERGILLLPPGATLTYFIGPASPELVSAYSTDEGITVALTYRSSETPQDHHDTYEISLLDRFGARSVEREGLA